MSDDDGRTLTDADVDAIVQRLRDTLVNDFHARVGRGVSGLVWKALLGLCLGLLAVGASRHLPTLE